MKKSLLVGSFIILNIFFVIESVFARAGGGGSSSGGGGGGSSGGSFSHSSGVANGSSGSVNFSPSGLIFMIIFFLVLGFIILKVKKAQKKVIQENNQKINIASQNDKSWEETGLRKRVEEVFYSFQKDWGNFSIDSMKSYLTENYFKRMVLEQNVLKNQKRQNLMENVKLNQIDFVSVTDEENNSQDKFKVMISAEANDTLLDTSSQKVLNKDFNNFFEYWHFVREGGEWKLDLITQDTENQTYVSPQMLEFAQKNNFYFDPDFGWLMMPDKGVIFSKTNFGYSDINNHVIGYYRNKIVEFYTYVPNPRKNNTEQYIVAQAILPISYENILIKKKKLIAFSPKGLRKIELESNDFNEKFNLWAAPKDSVNSLVLLAPDFMEKIYNLPFDLNIEIVGNTLYFYSKYSLESAEKKYQELLEVLSWAFDAMDG